VTIRTVDIGADKPLERMSVSRAAARAHSEPGAGLRAIRWSLSEPSMFRQQLRAILRASAFGKVRMLIPMVAHLREVRQIRSRHWSGPGGNCVEAGSPLAEVELGAMIEVPAAALMVPPVLRHFDFVSIGTNDLIQYTWPSTVPTRPYRISTTPGTRRCCASLTRRSRGQCDG
jgi:phosphotransferase system enzyme I (PtsI)